MITLILFFRSEDAGLIPQSLSLIFQKIQQHSQQEAFTVHISFFEIYRETAYDLLGCFLFNGSKKNREMPKVRMLCNILTSSKQTSIFKGPIHWWKVSSYGGCLLIGDGRCPLMWDIHRWEALTNIIGNVHILVVSTTSEYPIMGGTCPQMGVPLGVP